ncbi:MAG: hypothetical protein FWC70_08135 [Defluviitaleaceae bacterium]|nr:hypothetical protein [Defluviitaleaceae bacterium]
MNRKKSDRSGFVDDDGESDYTAFMDTRNGGKHYGSFITLSGQTDNQLLRSAKSYQANIEEHRIKINSPSVYVDDWDNRDERYHAGIIRKWNADIDRNQELLNIAVSIATERGLKI